MPRCGYVVQRANVGPEGPTYGVLALTEIVSDR